MNLVPCSHESENGRSHSNITLDRRVRGEQIYNISHRDVRLQPSQGGTDGIKCI
jgi:hypothetical protein